MQENSETNIQKNRDKYFDKIQNVIHDLKMLGYSNTDKLVSMQDGQYKYKMLMIIYMMNVINQQYNRVSSKLRTQDLRNKLDFFFENTRDRNIIKAFEYIQSYDYKYCDFRKVYWPLIDRKGLFTSLKSCTNQSIPYTVRTVKQMNYQTARNQTRNSVNKWKQQATPYQRSFSQQKQQNDEEDQYSSRPSSRPPPQGIGSAVGNLSWFI